MLKKITFSSFLILIVFIIIFPEVFSQNCYLYQGTSSCSSAPACGVYQSSGYDTYVTGSGSMYLWRVCWDYGYHSGYCYRGVTCYSQQFDGYSCYSAQNDAIYDPVSTKSGNPTVPSSYNGKYCQVSYFGSLSACKNYFGDDWTWSWGRWDASENGCVSCNGPIETKIYWSAIDSQTRNRCESACGAASACDEFSPGQRGNCLSSQTCDSNCQCAAPSTTTTSTSTVSTTTSSSTTTITENYHVTAAYVDDLSADVPVNYIQNPHEECRNGCGGSCFQCYTKATQPSQGLHFAYAENYDESGWPRMTHFWRNPPNHYIWQGNFNPLLVCPDGYIPASGESSTDFFDIYVHYDRTTFDQFGYPDGYYPVDETYEMKKCIYCNGKLEVSIYPPSEVLDTWIGKISGYSTPSFDWNLCESDCGASPECDEKDSWYERGYSDNEVPIINDANTASANQMRGCSGNCVWSVAFDSYIENISVNGMNVGDTSVNDNQNIEVYVKVRNTGKFAQGYGWWFVGVEFWKVEDFSDPWGTRSKRVDTFYNTATNYGCDISRGECPVGSTCSLVSKSNPGTNDFTPDETIIIKCQVPASYYGPIYGNKRVIFWVHERDLGQDAANNGNNGNTWWDDALARADPAAVRVKIEKSCNLSGTYYTDTRSSKTACDNYCRGLGYPLSDVIGSGSKTCTGGTCSYISDFSTCSQATRGNDGHCQCHNQHICRCETTTTTSTILTTSTTSPGPRSGGGGRMPLMMSLNYTNLIIILTSLIMILVIIFGFFKFFARKK